YRDPICIIFESWVLGWYELQRELVGTDPDFLRQHHRNSPPAGSDLSSSPCEEPCPVAVCAAMIAWFAAGAGHGWPASPPHVWSIIASSAKFLVPSTPLRATARRSPPPA